VFSQVFNKHFYSRVAPWAVLAAVVSVPLLVYGVRGALRGGDNDVRQWLPRGFRETQEYDRFLAQFGSEEMAVVSWPGCTVEDQRLDRLAAALEPYTDQSPATTGESPATDRPSESARPAGNSSARMHPLFKRVLTTRQAVAALTAEPAQVPHEEAIRRLSGLLVGPDGNTAAMIVMVNEAGTADRKAAVALLQNLAEQAGVSRDELRMAGPTVDSVALESESRRSRYLLTVAALMTALLLAWRCLKNVRLVAMVFAVAVFCAGLNVALVYFLGGTMNLLMGMMPTLIYLLGLSAAIHLVNYYREAVAEGLVNEAPLRAVKAAWLPCLLSAGTTAVGLGSLAISDVAPVRTFGIFSALGVLTSLPVLFLLLPSVLALWPVTERRSLRTRQRRPDAAGPHWTTGLANWVIGRHRLVTAAFLALLAVSGFGLAKLEMSVKLLNLFSPESRIIQDYAWLERHLGPMVPIEVVVRFDNNSPLSMLQRMQVVERIERKLDSVEKVGGTMSAATFAPGLPTGGSAGNTTRRVVLGRRLEQNRDHFESLRYLRQTDDGELWRISARVEALNSLDYGHFVNEMRRQVEPVLQEAEQAGQGRIEAVYTGIVPLVYKAQRTLLEDLLSSFLTSFVLIAGMMALMLRNVPAGLVAMLPNVLPASVLFGSMGLLGIQCDIGSMMTAGVAMGIAVDDTVHFLTWFRRGLARGLSRVDAIKDAYVQCATAMIQMTIVCGLGIFVFALSSFVPTSRFAWLTAGMLGVALLGDLILLPALLAGPLGKLFTPARPESTAAAPALVPAANGIELEPVAT